MVDVLSIELVQVQRIDVFLYIERIPSNVVFER